MRIQKRSFNIGKWSALLMVALGLFLSFSSSAYAKEIPFNITVDRTTVELGSAITLKMEFTGSQSVPAPELPQSDGWQAHYLGPSRMMSFVNGRTTQSVTHTYSLAPLKTGNFTIGPFRFGYKNNVYVSDSIELKVQDHTTRQQSGRTAVKSSAIVQGVSIDDYVFLTLSVDKRKAYLNEKIPVTIKFFISKYAIRDPQYPVIEPEGLSIESFDKPKQYTQAKGGMRYEVIEFTTTMYGTRPGIFTLGPATLDCAVMVQKASNRRSSSLFSDSFFDSMFGRFERHPLTVSSPSIEIEVLALPPADRPADFNGTLGSFNFNVSVGPGLVKVGDPITIRSTISGKGNFDTVTAPKLENTEGFKTYKPQVQVKSGKKIFEQIILPTNEDVHEVPRMSFTYFDTQTGTYQTLRKGPFAIDVEPAPEGNLQIVEMTDEKKQPVVNEVLGRDIVYVKTDPGALKKGRSFLFQKAGYRNVHLIPVLLFAGFALYARRKERLATDVRYRRRTYASRKAKKGIHRARAELSKDPAQFYEAVFKTLQEYLGDLFHLPSAGITADVIDELQGKNIPEEELSRLRMLFTECDMVRYAPGEFDAAKMQHAFDSLTQVIDYFERNKTK